MSECLISKQKALLSDLYKREHFLIDASIIAIADRYVGKEDTYEAMNLMFDDGAFDPFFDADGSKAYQDCCGENGNEDDECKLIGSIWEVVLTKADPIKYCTIILKFIDIRDNGL